jgi:hypothetical protein
MIQIEGLVYPAILSVKLVKVLCLQNVQAISTTRRGVNILAKMAHIGNSNQQAARNVTPRVSNVQVRISMSVCRALNSRIALCYQIVPLHASC